MSNELSVTTYTEFTEEDSLSFVPQHWSKGLTMIIEKDGKEITLKEEEIVKLAQSLPRTFGGSY